MKILAKPVEIVSHTTANGEINPLRFRLKKEDESYSVLKIEKVLFKQSEKVAGVDAFVYRCQSKINGIDKLFEVKYLIRECKWILWKM
jgi:hypothetical protein